jgi:hypothetical protein
MNQYNISSKDYSIIYEAAVREFNEMGSSSSEKFSNFLVRCVIKSFLNYISYNDLEVKEGKLYARKKDN